LRQEITAFAVETYCNRFAELRQVMADSKLSARGFVVYLRGYSLEVIDSRKVNNYLQRI
jgi:hypothetical protein